MIGAGITDFNVILCKSEYTVSNRLKILFPFSMFFNCVLNLKLQTIENLILPFARYEMQILLTILLV